MPLAFVLLGERFGALPWELEDAPLDRLEFYLGVMGVEGRTHELVDDLPDDETLVRDADG